MTRKATATIRTAHDDPELVARALRPDNTDEMETTVDAESGRVVTRIERETTSGLHSTVDDYVVNLEVATEVVERGRGSGSERERGRSAGTDSVTDGDSNSGTVQETDGHGTVSDRDPNEDNYQQ